MSKKITGKQLYIYVFLFAVYIVIPIILFSMYIKNTALMLIGFFLFFVAFVLAVFSIIKSWRD